MKSILSIIASIILIYLIMSGFSIVVGFIDKQGAFDHCNQPPTRIGVLFPAYKIGCYLGEPIE